MYQSLQYLRGIAALMVVAFHAAAIGARSGGYEPASMFTAGLAGVDLFFVISGFVMVASTAGRRTTPLAFLWKRVIRIVPLYWLLTLLVANVALLRPDLLSSTDYDGGLLLASLFFVPVQNPAVGETLPMLIPGWTLNYEMAFYLVFALALLLPPRRQVPAVIAVLVLAVSLRHLIPWSPAGAFYTMPLVLEFGAGMLIATAVGLGIPVRARLALACFVLGWIALLALAGGDLWRSLSSGLPATLIVAGAVFLERGRRLPDLKPLRWIGDASYSIYLTHVLTLPVLAVLWEAAGLVPSGAFIIACLLASVLGGLVTYHLVERPLLLAMRGWWPEPPAAPLVPRSTAGDPATPAPPAPAPARG